MGIICIKIGNIVRTMLRISYLYVVREIKKLHIIAVLQEITIKVYLNNSNCIIVHTTRNTTYQIKSRAKKFRNNEGLEFTFAVLHHNADHFCK